MSADAVRGAQVPGGPGRERSYSTTPGVFANMVAADLLKLRKKLGTLIWSLALACGPTVIFFIVRASQHAANPGHYQPAGGMSGFRDGMRILPLFFGPLAAVLIGVEAGAGDASSGVFRDLVATGRNRLALFAARVPAAVALCCLVTLIGFLVVVIGTYSLASGLPTPSTQLAFEGLGFSLLATAVICAVAVGFAALVNSRTAALVALIGWQLIASPILAGISSLGSPRRALLSQAIAHFSPVELGRNGHSSIGITMSTSTALIVMAAWLVVFLALGAWRTRAIDA